MRPLLSLRTLFVVLATALAGGLLFLAAMDRGLNHDEHQFLAPGALIAREGLMPYRDFPIFHLPNLAYIYAAMDRLTGDLVFGAKLVSVLASTGAAFLIVLCGTFGLRKMTPKTRFSRLFLATIAVVLLLSDPLFTYTAGKTWNHEVPAFLLLAAIVLQTKGSPNGSVPLLGLSGLCVGLAIGTRLTYLPAAGAFPLLLAFGPLPIRVKIRAISVWTLGLLIGLGPSIYFLITQREAFLFDNFQFPRLRLLDAGDTRVQKTATLWRKFRFFAKEILYHSWPLVIAAGVFIWKPLHSWIRQRTAPNPGLALTLLVIPFTVAGCMLPSRYQYQHFFALTPLLALAIAYGIRELTCDSPWYRRACIWILPICVASSLCSIGADRDKSPGGIRAYSQVTKMLDSRAWFSNQMKSADAILGKTVSRVEFDGAKPKVLTLAPAIVLQNGGRIYPQFATGPFAWRGARLVDPALRAKYKLVVPEDLKTIFDTDPPWIVLTGVEDEDLEQPIVDYVQNLGYSQRKISKKRILWFRTLRS